MLFVPKFTGLIDGRRAAGREEISLIQLLSVGISPSDCDELVGMRPMNYLQLPALIKMEVYSQMLNWI